MRRDSPHVPILGPFTVHAGFLSLISKSIILT